jgi:hypothetical protein
MSQPDILDRLEDLHKQATEERSHYYVGACVRAAMEEIDALRGKVVTLTERAVFAEAVSNAVEQRVARLEKQLNLVLKDARRYALGGRSHDEFSSDGS